MITRLDLEYFKCFSSLKLPLAPLTVLSGSNASGKSSIMQVMALLHQTIREHEWSTRLMLNGDAVQLGTVADVIDQVEGRRSVGVALHDGEQVYKWKFVGERSEMSMEVEEVTVDANSEAKPEKLRWLLPDLGGEEPSPRSRWMPWPRRGSDDRRADADDDHSLAFRLRDLTYLTAERLGPRDYYPLEDPQLAPVVGRAGEHTVSVLQSDEERSIIPDLVLRGVSRNRLRQVEARMARFFPGCELAMETVPRANVVRLGVRTSRNTEFHRPGHTGFGLTQVLPIVVASLSMQEQGILLIENPEVHLHPGGQASMGQFVAEVAAAGVQVVVETHSDHVLNGVRRAVKDGKLRADDVALHFFRSRPGDGGGPLPQVESPALDSDGNIDVWPDGFFDQFDRDMNYFAGWS